MSDPARQQHPEILDELAALMAASLVEDSGMRASEAHIAAWKIIDRFRKSLGGHSFYIPRRKFTVDHIRREIHRRWNGTNTRELCDEFGISQSRLRQLRDEALKA